MNPDAPHSSPGNSGPGNPDPPDPGHSAAGEQGFAGGGVTGALLRALRWEDTPLGPVSRWPQGLLSALDILRHSLQPVLVWWGPKLLQFYNDACIPLLGADKHPRAMGRPVREAWAEAFHLIEPALRAALEQGEPSFVRDAYLPVNRYGFLEECYFDYALTPLRGDSVRGNSGGAGGVFCTLTETTDRVLSERRLTTLRDLSAATRSSVADTSEALVRVLAENPRDLPFALLYLCEDGGQSFTLAAASGLTRGGPDAPPRLSAADAAPWPVHEAWASRAPQLIQGLDAAGRGLTGGPWPEPARAAVLLPIEGGAGVLVLGLSPRRAYDPAYERFLGLVAGHLGGAVAAARAFDAERRRAEGLAELDRAKTAFFANVSHEFRTPLTLILGPTEEALGDADAPAQRARLEAVRRNARRLLRLVNSLLEFSRLETGRLEASFEPTDLATLTAELASLFRSTLEGAGLTLNVHCPPLSRPVYVDRAMWEKVVLNLLSNAFKFTFEGGVSVSLKRRGDGVELRVADTGLGIPPEALPRLFERFYRVEGTRGRSFEGSGIGLALVRGLVRLHGGEVTAESQPGLGSAFTVRVPLGSAHLPADRIAPITAPGTISGTVPGEGLEPVPGHARLDREDWVADTLPAPPGAPPDAAAALSGASPHTPPARRLRVLVVDDNADMREYVHRLLGPRYDTELAADGEAGLALARTRPPDLVIADVMMPGLDGFQFLRALRADPALKDVPVILLSAHAGEEARIEGLQAGADDYLVKPFSAKELLARAAAHLDLADLRRQVERSRNAQERAGLRQALEIEQRLLRAVVHQLPVGLVIAEAPSGRLLLYNGAAARLLGRPARPEGGHADYARFGGLRADGAPYPAADYPLTRALAGETVAQTEMRHARDDGRVATLLVEAAPVRDGDGRVLAAVAVFQDISERKRLEAELRALNEDLESRVRERTAQVLELATALTLAEQQERQRVARVLHDDLQQQLYGLQLKSSTLNAQLARGHNGLRTGLGAVRHLISDAIATTRRLTMDLSPPVLEGEGLTEAVRWLAAHLEEAHGFKVRVTAPADLPVPREELRVLLFQLVRELLFNAVEHAGASEVDVDLRVTGPDLAVSVQGHGGGFDPEAAAGSEHFGLFNARDRLSLFGGRLDVDTHAGPGTRCTITVPIEVLQSRPEPV